MGSDTQDYGRHHVSIGASDLGLGVQFRGEARAVSSSRTPPVSVVPERSLERHDEVNPVTVSGLAEVPAGELVH